MRDTDQRIKRTLQEQAGVITTHQALACGLSRRLLDRRLAEGLWTTLARGVHHCLPEPTPEALMWAGALLGGESAAVTGAWACHLHGLAGRPDFPIDIATASNMRPAPQPWWRFRRQLRRSRGGPPRVDVENALLDAWGAQSDDWFMGALGKAVADRRTSLMRMQAAVAERSRVPRRRDLQMILGDTAAGARSPLERLFLRTVERAHGLPTGRRQVSVLAQRVVDVRYDRFRVIVELDGRLGHGGSERFRDMRRDNAHALVGHVSLRYGWSDVRHSPCTVAGQLAGVFVAGGWSDLPVRCGPTCSVLDSWT